MEDIAPHKPTFQELYDSQRKRYIELLELTPNTLLCLADYEHILKNAICRWDNTKLEYNIDFYGPHEGGYKVSGFAAKQWLSKSCSKCQYDWSLWKLGITK